MSGAHQWATHIDQALRPLGESLEDEIKPMVWSVTHERAWPFVRLRDPRAVIAGGRGRARTSSTTLSDADR